MSQDGSTSSILFSINLDNPSIHPTAWHQWSWSWQQMFAQRACWQPKLSSTKICEIKVKISSLASKLIFIQVLHVYALCWTGLFLDISNIICKEIRRCPKTCSKMGSNYWFECTRMKPSLRRLKQTYVWHNFESIWEIMVIRSLLPC
jgi:hypothetical protein